MSKSTLVSVLAIVAVMSASAIWRLNTPPLEPKQTTWLTGGFAQMDIGQFGNAKLKFQKVLTQESANRVALEQISFIDLLGPPFSELTNAEALVEYESLKLQHTDSPYLKIIGSILNLRNNAPEESIQILHALVKDNPAIPHLWFSLAKAQRGLGNHQGAIKSLNKALTLGQREIYFEELANEYFYAGDWNRAKQSYLDTLEVAPWRMAAKIGLLRSLVLLKNTSEAIEYGNELILYVEEKSSWVERRLRRSMIGLIRGTDQYSSEWELTIIELQQFLNAEVAVARKIESATDLNRADLKANLNPKVYAVIEFELNRLSDSFN